MSKIYAVGIMRKSTEIVGLDLKQGIELSWVNGMTGCIPVFEDRKKAMAYAGDTREVFEFEIIDEDQNKV